MFKKLITTLALGLTLSTAANAGTYEQYETYFTDMNTYVDWLKVDNNSREIELAGNNRWRVASYEQVKEMVLGYVGENTLNTGYLHATGGCWTCHDDEKKSLHLMYLGNLFGSNFVAKSSGTSYSFDGYAEVDRVFAYSKGKEDDIQNVTYFEFGEDRHFNGNSRLGYRGHYTGYYQESDTQRSLVASSTGSAQEEFLSDEPVAFMFRLNDYGYRNGLIQGVARDISAPAMLGALSLGLMFVGRRK